MSIVCACDLGFGNSKAAGLGRVIVLPSAVARPVEIGEAGLGMKVAKRPITVTIGEENFVVGKGAWDWGEPIVSMDYESLFANERLALIYAALAGVTAGQDVGPIGLVVGLPISLMENAAQLKRVVANLGKLKGVHEFTVDGRACTLQIEKIKRLSQPAGAYADWAYDDDGKSRKGSARATIAIADLGLNTFDLMVARGDEVQPRYVGGDKVGVRRLIEMLRTGYDLIESDAILREINFDVDPRALADYRGKVMGVLESFWPEPKRFTTVILTGGGMNIIGKELAAMLEAKGATVYVPDDPVTSNVRGLEKFGKKYME